MQRFIIILIIDNNSNESRHLRRAARRRRTSIDVHLHNDTREKFRAVMQILPTDEQKSSANNNRDRRPACLSRLFLSRLADAAQQHTLSRFKTFLYTCLDTYKK